MVTNFYVPRGWGQGFSNLKTVGTVAVKLERVLKSWHSLQILNDYYEVLPQRFTDTVAMVYRGPNMKDFVRLRFVCKTCFHK